MKKVPHAGSLWFLALKYITAPEGSENILSSKIQWTTWIKVTLLE